MSETVNAEERRIRVAIDGPSGSGKSTAAKNLAALLNIEHIDTGAMYRAAALKALREDVPLDEEPVRAMMAETDIDFSNGTILLDGRDVGREIRTLEVSAAASKIAALQSCRSRLVEIQREIASRKSVVMDGRDIGSNVLPDAEYKFFVTASIETRARRRWAEIGETDGVSLEDVEKDLRQRDHNDMTRSLNPLVRVADAVEIATDSIGIPETAEKMLSYIRD